MAIEGLVRSAASLVGDVELVEDLSFSTRATVARLRVVDSGERVVAKQPFEVGAYARELTAMQTIPEALRPALVGAGDGLIVMEDLGTGPALADLLLGDDPDAAEAALLAWARTLGTVLRATLRTTTDGDRQSAAEETAEEIDVLRGVAGDFGVTMSAAVEDDVARLEGALARPGPWLAYCPGDTCPDNNRVLADGSVRLFDFEGSGWRHAAMEAAYCRAPFPTCWCVAELPGGTTRRMEDAFLAELDPPDLEGFSLAVDLATAHFTLMALGWFRRFATENGPVGPPGRVLSGWRQYGYKRLAALAGQREQLPALAELASRLTDRIVERWPDAVAMPPYPAFRRR